VAIGDAPRSEMHTKLPHFSGVDDILLSLRLLQSLAKLERCLASWTTDSNTAIVLLNGYYVKI
jgi:hypothetical protein